ncbi:MAG: PEP-CTERM sorting domain-containing protein [Tepidisphaeraceae bacterium]
MPHGCQRARFIALTTFAILLCALVAPATAQISKGHQILIDRGLQVQGMVTTGDNFHIDTYKNANYSTVNWLWESNFAQLGTEQNFPWARWVGDESTMPAGAEVAHAGSMVALQLGDEWNLNDDAVRTRSVNWLNSVRSQYPNTLLYMNNWGTQIGDAALGDFVQRAKPDLLCFDTYPYQSTYIANPPPGGSHVGAPIGGPPTGWYGDLRRYRVHALNAKIPFGNYRQTFHAVQDYNATVYRDPSPSEQNLNTFGALAFGATYLIDFTYNTGATSMFNPPGGDSNPNAAYTRQADLNLRARSLGTSLTRLVPIHDTPNGGAPTTDILFLRGKTGPGTTDVTPLPTGFAADDALPNTMSEWVSGQNDPWMAGFVVTNLGTRNGGLRGDALISWFKPLDATLDDPADPDDQLYFMITNGMTGIDGAADEYRQQIQINFLAATPRAEGDTIPSVLRFNQLTGDVEKVFLEQIPSTARWKLVLQLDGGMGELYKFNTGGGFVGVPEPASLSLLGLGLLMLRRRPRIR